MPLDTSDASKINGVLGAAGIVAMIGGLDMSKFFFVLCVVMIIVALIPKSE